MFSPQQQERLFKLAQDPIYRRVSKPGGMTPMTAFLGTAIAEILLSDILRYDPEQALWRQFNGKCWAEFHSAENTIEQALQGFRMISADWITGGDKLLNAEFIPQVVKKLKQTPSMQIYQRNLDLDRHLLNLPTGTLDLRTMDIRPARGGDYISLTTGFAPENDKDGEMCPHYMQHLKFVCQGDPELMQFMEALSGYVLTGETKRQEFYFWYGHGNNGKSCLANIWGQILGEYKGQASAGQFSSEGRTAHKEQDAALVSKRLVVGEEIGGNSAWDISKLKEWTGGGAPIKVRHMYGSSFEFQPHCKLILLSNHRPAISSTDYGFVRRLRIVNFRNTISPLQIDDDFGKKLTAEAPYIMYRMIAAAGAYYSGVIAKQTELMEREARDYVQSQNVTMLFVDEHAEHGESYDCIAVQQFKAALAAWCVKNDYALPDKVSSAMEDLGYKSRRGTNGTRVYASIRWRQGMEPEKSYNGYSAYS